jgi:hypothetical protein
MTEARLEANRRSAKKSTGPRTPAGKARSRMNGLRHGGRHPSIWRCLPPWAMRRRVRSCGFGEASLTPAQRMHPLYVGLVEMFTQVEANMVEHERWFWDRHRRNFSRATSEAWMLFRISKTSVKNSPNPRYYW